MTTPAYIFVFAVLGSLAAVAVAGIILALPEWLRHRLAPHLISYAIKENAVVSGEGGTGKTSMVASFDALAGEDI